MYLCFVDESNQGDFYAFAGLMVNSEAAKKLTDELNAVVNQAAVDFGIPRTSEIHAYPLFHGKEVWSGVPTRARIGVFNKVLDAICRQPAHILMRGVPGRKLAARQSANNYPVNFPPEQVAFQHLLQRVDSIATREETYALIIADNRSDRERHRDHFALYQTHGTPGVYMHTNLPRLLDTVHFAPSGRSRLLQAADILAFIYRRCLTTTEADARAAKVMDDAWSQLSRTGHLYDIGTWP